MTDTPTPAPEPTPNAEVPTESEIQQFVAFITGLFKSGNIRQELNPLTYQFWVMLGSVAAIVLSWLNPGDKISATVQGVITGISGLVLAIQTAQAAKPTVSTVVRNMKKLANLSDDHKSVIAKTFSPTPLVPSPAGQVKGGYYAPGTALGSVLPPGAVVVVPGYSGAPGASGNVSPGLTNEGHVVSPVTVNVQQGGWTPGTGAEPYAPINPNAPLPNQSGNNSAEGTGGPVISQTHGGLGQGGSVESPGAYVQPASPTSNPDEANPNVFVAKDPEPEKRTPRHRKNGGTPKA